MDMGVIFVKTPKGTAEIAARGGALSLAARRVLIMVDGKRTVGDLAPLLRPGEIDGVITTLESMGFIQRAAGEAPRPAEAQRSAEVAAPAPEERSALSMDELKHRAVRELNDRLGPDAEVMAIRIEQARTPEELRERVREAERLVSGLLGEPVAQEFLRVLRRR